MLEKEIFDTLPKKEKKDKKRKRWCMKTTLSLLIISPYNDYSRSSRRRWCESRREKKRDSARVRVPEWLPDIGAIRRRESIDHGQNAPRSNDFLHVTCLYLEIKRTLFISKAVITSFRWQLVEQVTRRRRGEGGIFYARHTINICDIIYYVECDVWQWHDDEWTAKLNFY